MKSLRFRTEEPRSEWSCSSWCPGQMAQLWLVCRKNNWTPCLLLLSYGGFPSLWFAGRPKMSLWVVRKTGKCCSHLISINWVLELYQKTNPILHVYAHIYNIYIYIYKYIYIYISYVAFQMWRFKNTPSKIWPNKRYLTRHWSGAIRTSSIIVLADLSSPGTNFCDALNFSVLVGYWALDTY